MTSIRLDIDWFFRLCEHVRYHADSVDTGSTRRPNPRYDVDADVLLGEPANFYHHGWYLDACGTELCFEAIDSSFTIQHAEDTRYVLSGSGWSILFQLRLGHTIGTTRPGHKPTWFQGRWGLPIQLKFRGDPDEFDRQCFLIELVLPMRDAALYKPSWMVEKDRILGVWNVEIE